MDVTLSSLCLDAKAHLCCLILKDVYMSLCTQKLATKSTLSPYLHLWKRTRGIGRARAGWRMYAL